MNKIRLILICSILFASTLPALITDRGLINYPNYYFIETGTGNGNGVQEAIDTTNFLFFYTMDVFNGSGSNVHERFASNPNVNILKGDTGVDLDDILTNINLPATIWLDAEFPSYSSSKFYYDKGITAQISPLLNELNQIKDHYIKTHTILINNIYIVCEMFSSIYTLTDIENAIYAINDNYIIEYVNGGNDSNRPKNVLYAYIP